MKSWVEISGTRLVENLRAVQSVAGAEVEVLAVVKANGYGHGAALVAQALVQGGARWLGVNDVEEGAEVRASAGDEARLLVMCGMDLDDAPALVAHGLTPVVWTVEHIEAMERAAAAVGQRARVHIEVESGMARQGAPVGAELQAVLERVAASQWVICEGVMSHLACSELAGSAVTEAQRERFAVALGQVAAVGPERLGLKFVHLGNTSAVDEGSTMAWMQDTATRLGARAMVRTGLAVFGYALELEGGGGVLRPIVRPVMTWKTRVTGVREIEAGTTVGYGATFVATQPMRLALLPVGYADGFRREASSGMGDGWVMIAGRKAAVVGRVSMNLTVVDVTGISADVGDEVVLLGEGVTAEDHARWSGTIAYDVLCGVKALVEMEGGSAMAHLDSVD